MSGHNSPGTTAFWKGTDYLDRLPNITITAQSIRRPGSPLRESFLPDEPELNEAKIRSAAVSQTLLEAIQLQTPEKAFASADSAQSRSPLLTPPLSEGSTGSPQFQHSPNLSTSELHSEIESLVQGNGDDCSSLQGSHIPRTHKAAYFRWEGLIASNTSTPNPSHTHTGGINGTAILHPTPPISKTHELRNALGLSNSVLRQDTPLSTDSTYPPLVDAQLLAPCASDANSSYEPTLIAFIQPEVRDQSANRVLGLPLEGQVRILAHCEDSPNIRSPEASVDVDTTVSAQTHCGRSRNRPQQISDSHPIAEYFSDQASSRHSRTEANKRASWQSTLSENSSFGGSQMALNTSTSSGGALLSAFVEKVTELEIANKAILEERDYLENRAQIAEYEYEKIKRELKVSQSRACISGENHKKSTLTSSTITQGRLRPNRTVSADGLWSSSEDSECVNGVRKEGHLQDPIRSTFLSQRRGQLSKANRSRTSDGDFARGKLDDNTANYHLDQRAFLHTRTLSLVEKMNKQRASSPTSSAQVNHAAAVSSMHERNAPCISQLEICDGRSSRSGRLRTPAGGDMLDATDSTNAILKLGEPSHDAMQGLPAEHGRHALARDDLHVNGNKSYFTSEFRPRFVSEVPNGLCSPTSLSMVIHRAHIMEPQNPRMRDGHPKEESQLSYFLAQGKLRSSLDIVLQPIQEIVCTLHEMQDSIVKIFIRGFVWIQFAGYLLVAIGVTMYRGPTGAGIAASSEPNKRLTDAQSVRRKEEYQRDASADTRKNAANVRRRNRGEI